LLQSYTTEKEKSSIGTNFLNDFQAFEKFIVLEIPVFLKMFF